MKSFLLFFATLFFTTTAFTQTTYSNSYDITESSDNAFRIFQKDSLIFTVSLGLCGTFQSFVNCTGILCTNLAGEEQWKMAIDNTSWIGANAVTITEDYLYLALQSAGEPDLGPQLFKVDFFGNLVESADIIDQENFWVYGIHKVEDGFKLYVGKTEEANDIYGGVIYLNEDYEQVSLYRYTFEEMIQIIPNTMVELGDDGSNIIVRYVGTDELRRTTMIRLDQMGNVLWTYPMLGENTPSSSDLKILHIPDEGFYVSFIVGFDWDPLNLPKVRIAKFSETGDLIWSRDLNNIDNSIIEKTFVTNNQEIVGMGTATVDNIPGLHGYINRFDLEGSLLWEHIIIEPNFSANPFNFLHEGVELENGDLIFCGLVADDNSGTPGLIGNTWLVRTTSDGCLDVDDCENLTPTEEVSLQEQKEFILYPNPADSYITIDADNFSNQEDWKIRIFNASGQLESITEARVFPHQLNTQNLVAGFYFLELENEKGLRKMLKFIRK